MLCPLAIYKPVANHGGPMFAHLGLVLHVQQGDGSLFGYFNDPATQVSAHLWLAKDGTMEQYVDTDQIAWAEAAGNESYLSVETEGFDTEPLTPQQQLSLARLLQWCEHVYGIPLVGPVIHGQRGFTPHCNPNGTPDPAWGNHTCPGPTRLGQMPTVLAVANNTHLPQGARQMDSVIAPNGDNIAHYRTPDNHLLEVTRKAGEQGNAEVGLSIIDITQAFPQFQVVG